MHCYFIARFDWSPRGSTDAVARHVSFGQITCTIAVQQFLQAGDSNIVIKEAQLSLGKTRYSLYHSSRKRFFRFFENSKNVTFYVFLNDLSKKRKKRNYINTA